MAEKIITQFSAKGYIENIDISKFISLEKEERKEVLWHLMDLSEEPGVKRRLYQIHQQDHYRYDARFEIMIIWIALCPSIKKSFDPKDVI